MFPKLLLVLLLTLLACNAFAEERINACVKFQVEDGWSEGISVDATVYKGIELNGISEGSRYTDYLTYVAIIWGIHKATFIEMETSLITEQGTEGVAQDGQTWKVAETFFCY